jgi:CHAD domain-containing protein
LKQLRESLIKYFRIQSKNFAKLSKKVYRKPSVKSVHQLRVALRRMRASLWILQHSSRNACFKNLNRKLRKLVKHLGRVRELDVALEDADLYGLNSDILRKQRKRNRLAVRRIFTAKLRKKIDRQTDDVIGKIRNEAAFNPYLALRILRQKLVRWLRRTHKNDKSLHKLRIQFKKTRYVLEGIGRPVDPLREVQQSLGKIHDLEVLQELLGKNKSLAQKQTAFKKKARGSVKAALGFAIDQLK